jgi:hypothetical protein
MYRKNQDSKESSIHELCIKPILPLYDHNPVYFPQVAHIGHGVSPTIRVVLQLAVWVRVGTLPCGGVNPGSHVEAGGAHE